MACFLEDYDGQLRPADPRMTRRILYVQFTDPAAYPPVEHSSSLLAERGWQVSILATGMLGDLELQLRPFPRICVKKMGFVQGGWAQKLQYLVFFCWTLYWTLRWQPQWIYASDPLACPVVWWCQKFIGGRVLYHEHDSPDLGQAHTWFMRQVFAYREKLARNAELCVLPQQERLHRFLEATGRTKPAYCVWNCPRLDEIAVLNPDDTQNESHAEYPLIIYYHGSITPTRLPIKLIVATSRFKGAIRVRIAGYETLGSIGYIAELTELAAKHGAAGSVECLGTIPSRKKLLGLASKAHIGLSLMPKQSEDFNMQRMVGASNKPFDYMACGLPLLVSNLPEWISTFVKAGFAIACDPDDPDSIEAALRWYLEHPEQRREMGQKCKVKIRRAWNYENEFARVLEAIERADGSPSSI
jgi:glycosyltransferase involved in cell wall biosynthesis